MEVILKFHQLLPHIFAGILLFLLIFLLFKNRSRRLKITVLYALWAVGLVLLVVNKTAHYLRGEHILAQLPLHLCYIALIFFLPAALKTRKKVLLDFIFYINAIGAFAALVFPAKDYVDGAWSVITVTYVVFHLMIVYIPLLLFLWGEYSAKINLRESLLIAAIVSALALAMFGLNLILVNNGVLKANYFWTLKANAEYNVTILRLFASIIPYDFLFLAVFAAPALAAYILSWKAILWLIEKRKSTNQNSVT